MRILGLDASTTTIGLSIIESSDGYAKLVHFEYYKPPKDGTIFERLLTTKKWFVGKLKEFLPDELVVEDIILFLKGGSGAKTIIPLSLFNRTLGLSYYEETGKLPVLLNVLTIRHALKFDKQLPAKEDMPEVVAKHLGLESFPYYPDPKPKKMIASAKGEYRRARELGVLVESFDVADSMAAALAYIIKQRSSPVKKKPSKHKGKS